MMSPELEEQEHSQKRSRASNSEESQKESGVDNRGAGGSKKARGRPRVDPRDTTAADRRRTQIRLAQRAYRQRKETTISSLKSESSQLHHIIEQMNKTFLHLNESALKSGLLQLNPSLAQEFKRVTETFTNLAKTATEGQYDADEELGEDGRSMEKDPAFDPRLPNISENAQDVGWGYSVTNPTGRNHMVQEHEMQLDNYFAQPGAHEQLRSTTGLATRRSFTVGEIIDQTTVSQSSSDRRLAESQPPVTLPFGLLDILGSTQGPFTPPNPHIYSVNIPTPDVTPPTTRIPTPPSSLPNSIPVKSLPPIMTYSFDETTFARRLTRAAIEKGFQVLSTPSIPPAALSFIFKLSMPYLTVDNLIERFKSQLSRGIDEDLDWWPAPFIHLGGAGTHYPRRDASGRIVPIKNSWTVRQIGPVERKMARLESVEDGSFENLAGIDLSDFEGEWFDAHDVQGYLEESYAFKLDNKSSFAECVMEGGVDDNVITSSMPTQHGSPTGGAPNDRYYPPSLTYSSSATSASVTPPTSAINIPKASTSLDIPLSSIQPSKYPAEFSKSSNYDISFDQTLGLDLAPCFMNGFGGNNGFSVGNMDLDLGLISETRERLPVVRQKRKCTCLVDINRLLDEIIRHGVCLGRAPGFRKKDVDVALRKALLRTI